MNHNSGIKVLFIAPKIMGNPPWFPIGFASIISYLSANGIHIEFIDCNFNHMDEDNRLYTAIEQYQPNYVGIGGMTIHCNEAIRIGKIVKKVNSNIKLVYGGVHFSFKPEDGLIDGDICILGEAEKTFLELCKGYKLADIDGIAYIKGGNIIINKQRKFISKLDELPFPDFKLINIKQYGDRFITGEKAFSIMTSRGCSYNCIFCASPNHWKRKVRYYSIDYIIEYIKKIMIEYNIINYLIMDDCFTTSKKRVFDFCNAINTHGLSLKLSCLTHTQNADYELFKKMKETGFFLVTFGVESGNDNILNKINKGTNVSIIKNAVKLAKKAGLDTELLFMVGNIGENEQTIMDSINLAKEINPVGSNSTTGIIYNWFQVATPFPGSTFYNVANKYGKMLTYDYDKYTHHTPVFLPYSINSVGKIDKLRHQAITETN